MFAEFLNDIVIPAIITVLGALVTVGAAYAVTAIRAFGKKLQNQWAEQVLERALVAAQNAVHTVNQMLVADLKAASEDGTLSVENGRLALNRALLAARRQMGVSGMANLTKAVGDEGEAVLVLSSLIEAEVDRMKQEKALAVS